MTRRMGLPFCRIRTVPWCIAGTAGTAGSLDGAASGISVGSLVRSPSLSSGTRYRPDPAGRSGAPGLAIGPTTPPEPEDRAATTETGLAAVAEPPVTQEGPPAAMAPLSAGEPADSAERGDHVLAEDLPATWVAPSCPGSGAVPTGPWGRPLRPDRRPPSARPTGSRDTGDVLQPDSQPEPGWPAYRMVAPPPPAPGLQRPNPVSRTLPGDRLRLGRTTVAPARPPSGLRLRDRRWVLEAAGAAGLLALLAAVLVPAAPPPPDSGRIWAARADPLVVALGRDVVELQSALGTPRGPIPGATPAVRRLRHDLRRARAVPPAPHPALSRPWAMAVRQASAAVVLLKSGRNPDPASLAAARADLDQAGQALVAVAVATRPPVPS